MKTIAYLGPENTNTHAAARKRFGARARYIHAPTVEDVFHLVEREDVDYGVVPIENSLGGAVTHTQDRFVDFKQSPVCIQGMIELPIKHFLLMRGGAKGGGLHLIETVYSHPQALTQCHDWLNRNVPQALLAETRSTAEAMLRVKQSKRASGKVAAVGPKELATKDCVVVEIPQNRENKTRFLVLGLGPVERGRANKTSVMFALQDKPGALYDVLTPFKKHGINLTKIESHPNKRKAWEYVFFIDLEGHIEDLAVKKALAALDKQSAMFRVLGSYPVK